MRSFIFSVLYAVLLLGTITSAWPWRPYGLVLGNGDTLDKRAGMSASLQGIGMKLTTDNHHRNHSLGHNNLYHI